MHMITKIFYFTILLKKLSNSKILILITVYVHVQRIMDYAWRNFFSVENLFEKMKSIFKVSVYFHVLNIIFRFESILVIEEYRVYDRDTELIKKIASICIQRIDKKQGFIIETNY